MGQRHLAIVLGLAAGAAMVSGCTRIETLRAAQSPEEIARVQSSLEPTVRYLPEADLEMLWSAMRGYMSKVFPLEVEDRARRVVETRTLEWDENGLPHRTRITVEALPDPASRGNARLGVVALLIEPSLDLEGAESGRPLARVWRLAGNNPKIEEVVADQIMRRYLLLRQGRDPDSEPLDRWPEGLRAVPRQP